MIRVDSIRLVSVVLSFAVASALPVSSLALGLGTGQGQSSQVVPAKPSADVPQASSIPATQTTLGAETDSRHTVEAAQRLDVDFAGGQMTVDASNASLNRILHEIGSKASIKITGSVSEDKVFGHYGPAPPAAIMAMLLDGTGSNMLLVDNAKGASELILTQRVGGVTPPSPLAAALETTSDEQNRPTSRYVPPGVTFRPPGPGRGPLVEPPGIGPAAGGQGYAAGRPGLSNPPETPSDTQTPAQIYEQLQQANQQRQTTTQSPQ